MNDVSKPDYKAGAARTFVPSIIGWKRDSSRYHRARVAKLEGKVAKKKKKERGRRNEETFVTSLVLAES